MATYEQDGKTIDYTPVSAMTAGDVVDLGNFVGVVVSDLAANEKGALQIEGVFKFAKTADEEIARGAVVYWDDSEDEATTVSGYGDAVIGLAMYASAAAETEVIVKLVPGLGDALA